MINQHSPDTGADDVSMPGTQKVDFAENNP